MSEFVLIVVLGGAAVLLWRCQPRRIPPALGCGGLAALMVVREVQAAAASGWLPAILAGLLVLAVAVGAGWYRLVHLHHRHQVRRWGKAVRRKHGVASNWDVLRYGSSLAMRRQATKVRPSMKELPIWDRLRSEATEFAVPLCQTGVMRVWASVEDVVLAFGIPRYGKSAWLGCHVLDAPGAVVTTSTKTDLYEATHPLRAQRGPVSVFNPTGVGGVPSTISFDPVSGCDDPVVAGHRAEDML
ncbi:MAG: type IV secretory system conjugative DNA transfer family protein, partial [Actinomycetes bacterium]